MDQELKEFQEQGLAEAVEAWDDVVIVTTTADTVTPPVILELHGVQSGVEVDPGELEQFGFNVKRVFSLTVVGDRTADVKSGMRALEVTTGETARVLYSKRDRIGTTFFFGTVNQ